LQRVQGLLLNLCCKTTEFNDEIYEEIGRTIGNAIIEIATYASPYIKLWWNKKAIPSLKKKKDKIARKIKNKD